LCVIYRGFCTLEIWSTSRAASFLLQYDQFIAQLERLVEEPCAYIVKDFIMQFVEKKQRQKVGGEENQLEVSKAYVRSLENVFDVQD